MNAPFTVPPAVPLRDIIARPTRHWSAAMELSCAFPASSGLNGAATSIADLSRHGLQVRLFTPTKRSAVRLITDAAMQAAEAHGHGNAAVRRASLSSEPHPVRKIA